MPFTSDPSTHTQCFNVTIIGDDILEATERFNLTLSLVDGSSIPVTILPDESEVEIVDIDCKSMLIDVDRLLMSRSCSHPCWI